MKFLKKILKNGLRVITVPMKDNPTVTVLVLVEAGSKYENKNVNGISHFLEHMCFKGTVKRPKATDISKELDALGSQYNAFTAQEYTGYYAKTSARHFRQIFDIVSDVYLNSTFPEVEMQKEKGVIIEEINMYEDQPQRHVQDLFMKLLYGDPPAGGGGGGGGKKKKILKKVKGGKKGNKKKTKDIQSKPKVLVKFKETDQTHFVLGVRSYDLFSKKNAILSVLAGVLGAGMSSRLFVKLREELGVGYYVRAYNDAYTDHGFFQISAGVDNKRIEEVLEAVLEECKKLKIEKVSKEELNKVKECLIGNMKLSLELSDDIANFYGGQELLKKEILEAEEKAKKIRKVTESQVQALAKSIFKNNKLNLALIGPFKEKVKFLKILKF